MAGTEYEPTLGALATREGTRFRLWAPLATKVELLLEGSGESLELQGEAGGYFSLQVEPAIAGSGERYRYRVDDQTFPDPATRYQPDGVHGASLIVDPAAYRWRNRPSVEIEAGNRVIYELHVGTFTTEGSFDGVVGRLDYLAELGITTIELMPVADFPGRWNWGYDPGAFYAPSRAYGEPDDLRRLVDEAHGRGLEIILDVVYNHFGPDGAYLPAVAPFALTDRHHTPWGQAIDYGGTNSEGIRRYFLENALMWLHEYRFDGLRLDATFAIIDESPTHFLEELRARAAATTAGRALLIAEDPRNLRNLVISRDEGGVGLDGVWADDLHHQLRVRSAGDDRSYFGDFSGSSADIARTLSGNWFYSGHHSDHHGAPRGTPAGDLPAERFVVCIQNHDQVGNRPDGARLSHEVEPSVYHALGALLLFAPQTPLLFMGQEWAASTPFLFFTDHSGRLAEQVSAGRAREFADFDFGAQVPDPQDPATFERSRLDWEESTREPHRGTAALYRDLLRLRPSLRGPLEVVEVQAGGLSLRRGQMLLLVAFDPETRLTAAGASETEWKTEWSSESADYIAQPRPPQGSRDGYRFSRPGALLLSGRVAS